MKYLISVLIFMFITGCSVQIVEVAPEPTEQKFDLTDIDSDGVILARDNCEESYLGAQVDNNGCGTQTVQKIRHTLVINFDNESDKIKPEFYDEIKSLANFMKEYPSTKVMIEGHTSKQGLRKYNQVLSEKRALAVKKILMSDFSIDKNRISTIGYGFDRLLKEGDSIEAHAQNRRIIAEISSEKYIKDFKWTIYSVDEPTE